MAIGAAADTPNLSSSSLMSWESSNTVMLDRASMISAREMDIVSSLLRSLQLSAVSFQLISSIDMFSFLMNVAAD
jgi:hypothetical protein